MQGGSFSDPPAQCWLHHSLQWNHQSIKAGNSTTAGSLPRSPPSSSSIIQSSLIHSNKLLNLQIFKSVWMMGCNCGEVHLHKKGKHQHHTWINLELLNTTPFASHKQWLMWIKIPHSSSGRKRNTTGWIILLYKTSSKKLIGYLLTILLNIHAFGQRNA